jgi:hypothetical protein
MEQKQLMILLVLVVVIVVVVVAAVLLMGNRGPQTGPYGPATGGQPGGGSPLTGGVQPGTGGGLPTTGGQPGTGGGATLGQGVPEAIATGRSVICTMTMVVEGQGTTTANMKMEAPKMRVDATAMGVSTTLITADGVSIYMYSPMLGDYWIKYTADASEVGMPTPDELTANLAQIPEGMTLNCQITGDIPDSEFTLPAGAEVKDMSELMAGYGDLPEGYEV